MAGNGGIAVEERYQTIASVLDRDAIENGIKRQQRISRKIHLRNQAREQPLAKKRKMNVCRAPGIWMILPRVGTGFNGDKPIAALPIREHAAAAREIRVKRRAMLVNAMTSTPRRVHLPNFDQGSSNPPSMFIQHTPADDDSFSLGFPTVLVGEVVVVGADIAVAENRAGELR